MRRILQWSYFMFCSFLQQIIKMLTIVPHETSNTLNKNNKTCIHLSTNHGKSLHDLSLVQMISIFDNFKAFRWYGTRSSLNTEIYFTMDQILGEISTTDYLQNFYRKSDGLGSKSNDSANFTPVVGYTSATWTIEIFYSPLKNRRLANLILWGYTFWITFVTEIDASQSLIYQTKMFWSI